MRAWNSVTPSRGPYDELAVTRSKVCIFGGPSPKTNTSRELGHRLALASLFFSLSLLTALLRSGTVTQLPLSRLLYSGLYHIQILLLSIRSIAFQAYNFRSPIKFARV
jgi:hypothetical protein